MKKYLAPLLAIGVSLIVLLVAVFYLPESKSGIFDSSAPTYFVKPVEINRLYVVEPNLEGYMNEHVDPPALEDVLYQSLDELRDRYVIDKTEITQIERNGVVMPNLFVYVHPNDELQQAVDANAGRS